MGEDSIAEAIFNKGIQLTVVLRLVNGPVLSQFFGAEYQDSIIQQLKVFDDC